MDLRNEQSKLSITYEKLAKFLVSALNFWTFDCGQSFSAGKIRGRNFIFLVILLVSSVINIRNVIESYYRSIRIIWTINVAWSCVHSMAITKLLAIIFYKREFLKLLKDFQKIISEQQNRHIAAIQIPKMKKTISRIILSLIIYGTIFCLSELFTLIYVLNYPGVNFPLIYEIRELLAFGETFFFFFNMIFQSICFLILLLHILVNDFLLLFFGFLFHAVIQILAEIIEKCLYKDIFGIEPNILKIIIEKHLQIINLLKTLDKIFRKLSLANLLTNFLCLIIIFCGILFQEEFEGSLYMIALILMFQTFALSLFGEILAVNTGNIGDSLYLTEWYAMPLREQTSILFMMRLGQKTYGIKAGGLVAISFNTFVDVIKASMSYCALLYALTKN
uniref:Odorant receptor n=1 Tax=Lutzomyia longipalpis TaxID=7200 RepID=A0A3F2ZDH8_LUTLO